MNVIRTLTKATGASFVALALTVPSAIAIVTVNPDGTGFVGKGDVQTAFGWDNKTLQQRASGVTFSATQAAEQAVTQPVTQDGTQTSTQSVTQEVSCTTTAGRNTFSRSGDRPGSRGGSREGSRDGMRDGSLAGSLASTLDGDPRKVKGQNQFTGFILNGYSSGPHFTAGSEPVTYGDPIFDDWTFGDWTTGDVEWGDWVSDSGYSTPAPCLGGGSVTNLSDVTTYGAVVEGDITEGAIADGIATYGAVTATGSVIVIATSLGDARQVN